MSEPEKRMVVRFMEGVVLPYSAWATKCTICGASIAVCSSIQESNERRSLLFPRSLSITALAMAIIFMLYPMRFAANGCQFVAHEAELNGWGGAAWFLLRARLDWLTAWLDPGDCMIWAQDAATAVWQRSLILLLCSALIWTLGKTEKWHKDGKILFSCCIHTMYMSAV